MTEYSAEDKARAAQYRAVATAIIAALDPFASDDPATVIIGVAVALGSIIAVTEDPNLSYALATKAMRGIMTGELLD